MANLDTAAKRASGLRVAGGFRLLPIPDGTVHDGDKQHLLGFYSGIAFATITGSPWYYYANQEAVA